MGKTLGTRQKLSFRIEPSQRNLKPRSPLPSPRYSSGGPPHPIPDQQQEPETVSGNTPDQTPKTKTS
jgi:hypothetical protein